MPTIFDFVTAPELAAYWETMSKDRPPYLGETLFPSDSKLGIDLKWIKGAAGLPVVLKPSAFDVGVVPRPRLGFDRVSAEMPFFKESIYIDEELRQQLNMVMESGNDILIKTIVRNIFNDEMRLLEGARARREMMRMMMLTTGTIAIEANGQKYDYDYGLPSEHKRTVTKSWSDPDTDIMSDIRDWQDAIEEDTGIRPTRAVCNSKTWSYIKNSSKISKAIYVMADGDIMVSDSKIRTYIKSELDLEIAVYSKLYTGDKGKTTKFVPDDTFVLMPTGNLGKSWFGTTPEQSDLMTSNVANVSITDVGVAVTTKKMWDPVNVETKVSMITLPSFEMADQIMIADVKAA